MQEEKMMIPPPSLEMMILVAEAFNKGKHISFSTYWSEKNIEAIPILLTETGAVMLKFVIEKDNVSYQKFNISFYDIERAIYPLAIGEETQGKISSYIKTINSLNALPIDIDDPLVYRNLFNYHTDTLTASTVADVVEPEIEVELTEEQELENIQDLEEDELMEDAKFMAKLIAQELINIGNEGQKNGS